MIEQSYLTKDEQALKIFYWAAGAATLRAAYYGLKLGLFRAIGGCAGRPHARRAAGAMRRSTRAICGRGRRPRLRASCSSYDAAIGTPAMAPHMEALLLDDEDFQYPAGLVTNFAVESRLADRVEECFAHAAKAFPSPITAQEMVETIHAFSKAAYELFLPSVLLPELPELGRGSPTAARSSSWAAAPAPGSSRSRGRSRTAPSPASIRIPPRSRWRASGSRPPASSEHVHAEEMRGRT